MAVADVDQSASSILPYEERREGGQIVNPRAWSKIHREVTGKGFDFGANVGQADTSSIRPGQTLDQKK